MAKNLRAKIPASDTLIVRDVNEEAAKRFVAEAQEAARNNGAGANEGRVEIAENAREVAEKSVSIIPCLIDSMAVAQSSMASPRRFSMNITAKPRSLTVMYRPL
jgi:3-hydroxyisobutyrate dehydrogenase